MIYELPKIMLLCLSCTIIIECSLAYLFKIRKKDLLIVLLVNVITNPLLVSISTCINSFYGLQARNISMIFLELMAFLIEALIYKKVLDNRKVNPYLLSLTLNAGMIGDMATYANIPGQASSVTFQSNVGMLEVMDVLDASVTPASRMESSFNPNNYLIKSSVANNGFWTMNGSQTNSFDVWTVAYGTQLGKKRASRTYQTSGGVDAYFRANPVINIYDDVVVKGVGTANNPFVILGRSS